MVDVGDFRYFSNTQRVENGSSSVLLVKARSRFVPEFQRAEWRLSGSLGLYRNIRLLADAHHTRQVPSILDLEKPNSMWRQLKSPAYVQGWLNTGNDALISCVGGG